MDKDYVSAVVTDFGSTNSGCCILRDKNQDGEIVFTNPYFLHNTGSYAKDNTWIYFSPELLHRIQTDYDSLTDSDFRIESRIMPNTDNPNVVWGRNTIKEKWPLIREQGMVGFRQFKMMFYHGLEHYAGSEYDLRLVIKSFLRVLKIECLAKESNRLGRKVTADEILWALTIPAIWSDENKRIMVRIAREVFSPDARIISEPEGPLVYSLLMSGSSGKVDFVNDCTSFVLDLGGGTSDICLMREVKQPDGSYKMEMVANSDGSAAGGNDIDYAFYIYMLRKMSEGEVSDSGVRYDALSDDELVDMLFGGFQSRVDEFISFEDNWLDVKNRKDLHSLPLIPVTFTREYRLWLKQNGHGSLAARVRDYLLDGCEYPSDEFLETVFNPTVDKICAKVMQLLIQNLSDTRIDRITFAGGLSCNYHVIGKVRDCIRTTLGRNDIEFGEMGPLMAGGAIMAGALYILLNSDFIQRLARKHYYFDMLMRPYDLKEKYLEHGMNVKAGEIDRIQEESGSRVLLAPIFLKGELIKDMYCNDCLIVSDDQTELSIVFYSSSDSIVFSPYQPNTDIKKEAELLINCNGVKKYRLEVDFNQASTSDTLYYRLYDRERDVLLESGYILSPDKK